VARSTCTPAAASYARPAQTATARLAFATSRLGTPGWAVNRWSLADVVWQASRVASDSLAAVHAAGDRSHPFYQWAADHHAPHFAAVPGADQRYHALLRTFREETGPLTGASLAAACRRAQVG
jgi:hypothetical protein